MSDSLDVKKTEKVIKSYKTYNKRLMIIIDVILAAVLGIIDQLIKAEAVKNLSDGNHNPTEPFILIKNVLCLEYLENRGSAWGMFYNQKVFIIFVGLIFMAAIMFFLIKIPNTRNFLLSHVFCAMIISGGIGNMIDRFKQSYVVDYIYFNLINFPIFNFADCCVVIGVIGMFILFLFVYKEQDLEFLKIKKDKKNKTEK